MWINTPLILKPEGNLTPFNLAYPQIFCIFPTFILHV